MAKKTRIPELIVGKIYIDDGRGNNVYTLDVDNDNDGSLRIGDNKNGSVATINQNTGEISATKIRGDSLLGDGSKIEGLTQQELQEIESAKLVTISSDRLFFAFREDGINVDAPGDVVNVTANLQNIDDPIVWSVTPNTLSYSTNDNVLSFSGQDFEDVGASEIRVTATAGNLSDSTTIGKVTNGATGKSAVTILMPNDTVNFQATADGVAADLSPGESDIIVLYGSDQLVPTTDTPGNGEFKVTVAATEDDENITVGGIVHDVDLKKVIVGPSTDPHTSMIADSASITYTIEVKTNDGDNHTFEKVQTFTKSKDGWDGSAGKTLKLTADDYQIAYNQMGEAPDPQVINVTATPGGTSETLEYKFYKNNVAVTGWQTSNTHQFTPSTSHATFGKMTIKVEATTNSTEDTPEIYAHDSISVIGTKEGENVVRISADNPSHSFTVDADGTISSEDYDVGAINFNLYFGNTELSPNVSAVFDPEDSEEDLLDSFENLSVNQFAVNANASNSTIEGVAPNTQTIDFDLTTSGNILKSTPSNFGADETSAAVVFIFYARVSTDLILGPYTLTQTFSKSREGQQGQRGQTGEKGGDAKAIKLLADDYQVAYNAAGKAPDPQVVNLSVETQNLTATQTIQYRFTVDGNSSAKQNSGTFSIDVSGDSYDDFGKKKKIKVEVFENDVYVAEDSISIIATKEGSNAVEIVADNLAHQFTANTLGDLDDPSSGDNTFEVYIGNTQLTAYASKTSTAYQNATSNAFAATATYSGVYGVTSNTAFSTPDNLKLVHSMANASMNLNAGYVEYTIYVKDGDGEERGPYTKKQTLTRSDKTLSAKSLMITADNFAYPFDESTSTVPTTGEDTVTFTIKCENLNKLSKAPMVSVLPAGSSKPLKNLRPTPTGTLDANGTGEYTFSISYSDLIAQERDGNTGTVKSWFPIKVVAIGMNSGTQYDDSMNILAIDGGSNTVQVNIPNNNHSFVAEEDGSVDDARRPNGGSDVIVVEGMEQIAYNSSLAWVDGRGDAIELNTDEVGAPEWNFKKEPDGNGDVSYITDNGMITLSPTTQGKIQIDSIDPSIDDDTVEVEIFVRRSTGEGVTVKQILSYSKAKKGQKGKDVKNVNGDFSEGPVGWSAMDGESSESRGWLTPDDLIDLGSDVFSVEESSEAIHGNNVGVFTAKNGVRDFFWNSKTVGIGDNGRWDFDLRAASGENSGNTGHSLRWWIRLYKSVAIDPTDPNYSDDNPFTYEIKDIAIKNKATRDIDAVPYIVIDSWNNNLPMFPTANDNTITKEDDNFREVYLMPHKVSFTPAEFQTILSGASSFRVGLEIIPKSGWSSDLELIVDCCKATYMMVGNLVELDPDRAVALAGVEDSTEDLKDRWGHLVEETSEQNPEALFNGKLNLISQLDNLPQGVVVFNNVDSNAQSGASKPSRDDASGLMKWSSGANPEWILKPDSSARQKGILFKAVKIPSADHTMKISVTYYTTTAASNSQHPPFLRVYFKKDLPAGKKYINTGSKIVSGENLSKQSDTSSGTDSEVITEFVSPTIFVNEDSNGSFHLDSATEETKVFRVTFDDNSYLNTLVSGEEPTHASIALFTGWGNDPANASSLIVKEVALEWTLLTDNIISKSVASTLANSALVDMGDNIVANGVSAGNANAAAISAASEAQAAAATAATASETAVNASTYAQNTSEDIVKQSSANVNGNFNARYVDGLPIGIASYSAWTNSVLEANYGNGHDNGRVLEMRTDDGDYLRLKNVSTAIRTGILLPAVAIPENHFVEVTIKYRTNEATANGGALGLKWTDKELTDSQQYVGSSSTAWKTSARTNGAILTSADTYAMSEDIIKSSTWTEKTYRFGMDWINESPKYVSISVTGYFGNSYAAGTCNTDIKFINVNFKKNTYRSGTSYPAGMIPQRGDQFFRITDNDEYGWLSTYGENTYDFKVAGQLIGASTQTSRWPPMINRLWQDSGGTSSVWKKITCQPQANVWYWNNGESWISKTYLHSHSWTAVQATLRKKLFGPCTFKIHYTPFYKYDVTGNKWYQGQKALNNCGTIDNTYCFSRIRARPEGNSNWSTIRTVNQTTYATDKDDLGGTQDVRVQTVTYNSTKPFEFRIEIDGTRVNGSTSNTENQKIVCFAIEKIEIIGLSPTGDEKTETNVYYMADELSATIATFTGQHKCVLEGETLDIQGKLVSSTGKYDNMNFESEDTRYSVNPQEAVPVVERTTQEKDKKVLGVVCGEYLGASQNTKMLPTDGYKEEGTYTKRYEINSLGEGGIWVSDASGFLENGDYICSANIPGYGMKQDDDILRNYTVAKITQDCYFDLESEDYDCKEIEHDGQTYKIAFVGCTYHCG